MVCGGISKLSYLQKQSNSFLLSAVDIFLMFLPSHFRHRRRERDPVNLKVHAFSSGAGGGSGGATTTCFIFSFGFSV